MLLLLVAASAGCHFFSPDADGATPEDASARVDAASAPRDLALADLAAADRAVPLVDAALSDLGSCGGGFLNDDAAAACPLSCSARVEAVADEGHNHVAYPSVVTYQHNPPASGSHWPSPAPWGQHQEIVPPEQFVHNLEHGGVVFLYNCPATDGGPYTDASPTPDACPEVIAALVKLYQSFPQPMSGGMPVEKLILISPDPQLPGKVAAVAWDWSFVSDQVDYNALDCFLHARYNHGLEKFQ